MNGLHSHTEQFLRRRQALGAVRSDLELELLLALTFAVGETLDHHMIASGALETRAGYGHAAPAAGAGEVSPALPHWNRRTIHLTSK